jgi:hypothetical protein
MVVKRVVRSLPTHLDEARLIAEPAQALRRMLFASDLWRL